jgi:methylglutaconyl-CoA hydratase
MSTTFRVAAGPARLGLPETRLGIIPGAGGTRRLPALVGRQRALFMVLTGRVVAALDAEGCGLVDRLVVPHDETVDVRKATLDEAVVLAEQICAGAPVAVEQALAALRGWDRPGNEAEGAAYEVVLGTADRLEALSAFREKRAARFVGK